jgi:anti-sigma-K factor RskA
MMDRNELLDLIPAYALEALETDEKLQVEALLKTDAEARQILAEYQDITQNLILATPARRAPAYLQDDLRKRLAANRPAQAAVSPSRPEAGTPKRNQRRLTTVWMPLLAAAAVITLIFGVLYLVNRGNNLNPAENLYNQIIAMADHKTMHIPGGNGNPSGDMVATPDGSQAVLRVSNMPALQSDHTFQLWLIDDSGAHSGGLFAFLQPDSTYYVSVPLQKSVLDYKAFGVSVEPNGGSPEPSTTPIVVISTA